MEEELLVVNLILHSPRAFLNFLCTYLTNLTPRYLTAFFVSIALAPTFTVKIEEIRRRVSSTISVSYTHLDVYKRQIYI